MTREQRIEQAATLLVGSKFGNPAWGIVNVDAALFDRLAAALAAPEHGEGAREVVIRALYAACPFRPGEGCRQCRVCDAAAQVVRLPAPAPLPPKETP